MTTAYPEFSEFENSLIKRVAGDIARRFHLSREDRDDVQQELAVFLWMQKESYDPDHSSGSGYETYITKCLERKSHEILRAVRSKNHADDDIENNDSDFSVDCSFGRAGAPADLNAINNLAASSALSGLNPQQKNILKKLGTGKSIAVIAAESGISYSTAFTRVRRLRAILKKHGFDFSVN